MADHRDENHSRRETLMSEQTIALARDGFGAWQRGDFATPGGGASKRTKDMGAPPRFR